MSALAVKDRVCKQGDPKSIVYVIKSFYTVEQVVCVREDGKTGGERIFAVDKLEIPEPKPRKWKKSNRGGGMYESNDGWLVVKTGSGWFAQLGKVMSEIMPMKRDAYAWVERYEETQ